MADSRMGRSRLPELFKDSNKKRKDLAEYLGVSPSFISQVAKGKANFSPVNMKMTAKFFGCKMEDLND